MVISLEDFNDLNEKEKKKTLEDLKKEVGVSGIARAWDVSRSKAYSILNEYNIPMNPRKINISKNKATNQSQRNNESSNSKSEQNKEMQPEKRDSIKKLIPEGSRKHKADLELETNEEGKKFSMYLETQGTAPIISETLQMLLRSEMLSSSNLHVNITLQEI